MPEFCFCVVEGRGRLLHDDPGLRRPVTLAYSQPGDLVGWSGLVRRSPCEWLTAATPLKLIGFKAEDFFELERDSEPFSLWLDSNNSPSELMSVLAPALRARPIAEPPEREVLRRILPGLQVVPAHQIRELPQDDAVWLWNSQPISGEPVIIGEPVDQVRLADIPLGDPLRLVRVEKDLWTEALEPNLEAQESTQFPDDGVSSDDRYSDLLPAPQGDLQVNDSENFDSGRIRQRIAEVTEQVLWARPWPVWRCWLVITTCHSAVM